MADMQDAVQSAKDVITSPIPTPPGLKEEAAATDLQNRLNWGEPALTIIDVRSHEAFNHERIMGALNIPASELVRQAQANLETVRDIYLYSESDENTAQVAGHLREAGFKNVAELKGGLPAWKAIQGPTEGVGSA
jgi:rhodanese-related sulfurtransferase